MADERFAKMREDLPDRARLGDERNQPDVAAARRTLERKLLPHPPHEFGPRDSGSLVGVGLSMCAAAILSVVPGLCVHAVRRISLLPDSPDGQCRDGPPQLVIRREYPVVAMPVLPRWRDEIGEPVQKLKRREFDDAVGPRPR